VTISASVIIPTHNRPAAVAETVDRCIKSARLVQADVVVVDDGSTPPLSLPHHSGVQVVRTAGVERSRARNQGACAARGELLLFVDDDITVAPDFVEQHLLASKEFGDVIGVGKISLPANSANTPFGRFRRTIEEPSQARPRGLVAEGNFCTAANMSIRRSTFLSLGGFDPAILSGEDQDLALRFSARGGRIAYLPEADVIHRDSVANIASYARRHEWGARAMAPFLRRYPARTENAARLQPGTSLRRARSPAEARRILSRRALSHEWVLRSLRGLIVGAERGGAGDRTLFHLYRMLLGLHLFRGFREGLATDGEAPMLPVPLSPSTRQTSQND